MEVWERFTILFLSTSMMKLAFRPFEINSNLYFTQNWDGEISHKFTYRFNY